MNDRRPLIGIVIMILSMALFASKDGFAKIIVQDVGPAQIIWIQFLFTFTVVALITAPQHGWRAFLPTPVGLQVLRGLASVGGVGMLYWSLFFIPLADATAMVLTAPLTVAALSPVLLGEKIGFRRILAVIVGFAGVLVILRPGFSGDAQGYMIAAFSGVLFGLNHIGNRRLTNHHPLLVNIAHNVLIGVIVLGPIMPFVWVDPPQAQYFNMAGFLGIALVAQSLMVSAPRYAPASVIAPYQYTVIVFATVIGYLVFGTFPDIPTWAGITLIIGAGIFIAIREDRFARSKARKQPLQV